VGIAAFDAAAGIIILNLNQLPMQLAQAAVERLKMNQYRAEFIGSIYSQRQHRRCDILIELAGAS